MKRFDFTTHLGLFLLVAFVMGSCGGGSETAKPRKPATPLDLATVGTIRAEVFFDGEVPPADPISMRAAPACAALHDKEVFDPAVVAGGGHLANVFVYVKEGFGDRVFDVPSSPAVFDQIGCLYKPRVLGAMVGQSVQFKNSDPEAHNVRGRPKVIDSWNFMMSRQGSTKALVFDEPEIGVSVGCDIHPWMKAYLCVVDHPYFAVTGADGTVSLANVPPGDYVVAAWHEKLGTREQKVSLAAKGTATVEFRFAAK